jgi:lipopolysaccharide export system protein LptA
LPFITLPTADLFSPLNPLSRLLLAPAFLASVAMGQETSLRDAVLPQEPEHQLPAVSLMPAGSILTKVVIPRYDKNRQLTASLRADELVVLDEQTIEGKKVTLQFFNPDRTPKARADLKIARFDQTTGTLVSREAVQMLSDQFQAEGSGITYAYLQGQAFLLGPVNTRFFAPPQKTTSMNVPTPSGKAATALATALLALPAAADVPAYFTPEQRAAHRADAASLAPAAAEQRQGVDREIAQNQSLSLETNKEVAAFLQQAAIATISVEVVDPSATEKSAASTTAAPLEVTPGPDDTVVSSDDGMYFDSEKGVLVYLKNVKLTNPQFTLTGANELKVFLEKKKKEAPKELKNEGEAEGGKTEKEPAQEVVSEKEEEKEADKAATANSKPKSPLEGASFGNPDRIIATGAVKVVYKSEKPGDPPLEASASTLTYHVKTGEIILDGGYPWIKQGDKYMRAKQPDLYIRIQKDGSFVTEPGQWDMGGQLQQKPAAAR